MVPDTTFPPQDDLLGRFVAVTDLVQKGNQQKISKNQKNMNMSGLEYESVEGKATNSD